MCNIVKKRNRKQFDFVNGWAGDANIHLKIKGLPFSHEVVPELYPEKLHSCKEKNNNNRIHLRKNILVLETKDLHISIGLYLLKIYKNTSFGERIRIQDVGLHHLYIEGTDFIELFYLFVFYLFSHRYINLHILRAYRQTKMLALF